MDLVKVVRVNMKLLDQSVDSGVSQILNSDNQWALELWKKSLASNWSPFEAKMATDIRQWKNDEISDDEKLLVKRILGLFSAGESLVSNSIATVEYKYITDGCARQYLARKNYEESLHNATVMICCSAYGLDPNETAEAYKSIVAVKNKTKFIKTVLDSFDSSFSINSTEGKSQFIKNMYIVYMLMEGVWFFSSFAAIMCLGRQNKLQGLYEQIDYTISDETRHVEFGTTVIRKLAEEYPKSWTKDLKKYLIEITKQAVDLEIEFIKEAVPNGILGITQSSHISYTKFLANKRLKSVGLEPLYENASNPYTWISETQDSLAMENFFESTVRNYQSASALEDDF
jgi:ribonucleoside-diphosphate reductase beta chain